jgi:hypothetical protein
MKTRAKPTAGRELRDANGVLHVSLDTRTQRGFAYACLATWTLRDNRPRAWLMRSARSIDVPADIVEATRLRLAGERGRHSHEGNDD